MRILDIWPPEERRWRLPLLGAAALAVLGGAVAAILGAIESGPVQAAKDVFHHGAVQLGTVTVTLLLFDAWLARRNASGARAALGRAVAFVPIFVVVGELSLRAIFWNGVTFTRGGPIYDRFVEVHGTTEPHVEAQHPSRYGPKPLGTSRVLVQGDSHTCGSGLRDGRELLSNQLERGLRSLHEATEVALLCRAGREIDGHTAELAEWGEKFEPDLIVYQWNTTDMQLDPDAVPQPEDGPWEHFFAHRRLAETSFLYFMIDYNLTALFPPQEQTVLEYIEQDIAPGGENFARYEEELRRWAELAQSLAPHVVVALADPKPPEVAATERTTVLLTELGVSAILQPDISKHPASPYDFHPNERGHELIAETVLEHVAPAWNNDRPGPADSIASF